MPQFNGKQGASWQGLETSGPRRLANLRCPRNGKRRNRSSTVPRPSIASHWARLKQRAWEGGGRSGASPDTGQRGGLPHSDGPCVPNAGGEAGTGSFRSFVTMLLSHRLPLAALPLALAGISSPSLHAQTLGTTIVTATRMPTLADELVSEVKVIDRATIDASTARTLPELLARAAGVQVTSTGGRGKTSSVFIRGAENRHTILLVDGVRIGSATAGTPTWETIPVDMIERIEVLKGPGSALYGSDGVGGVVQIFTRQGREGFHPRAALTVGSEQHWTASAGVEAGSGALRYSLGFQRLRERGFDSTTPDVPFGNHNPDIDPFRQDAVNASVRYAFNPDWNLEAGAVYSDGISWYDDGPGANARTALRGLAAHAAVVGKVMNGWQTDLRVSQGNDTANIIEANFPGAFRTDQRQWTWQNTIASPIGSVLAGLERREQKIDATTEYTVSSRTINAGFLGLNGSTGPHSWQLNARRDRNSQFGTADTWFAGYGFRIAQAWRVHASRGTSFVAPSFNQLYFPKFGNPDLQPERGTNTDVGVTWSAVGHEVKLVRFDNRIRGFMTNTTLPVNIPHARIDGWTLGYEGRVDAWALRANLESIDPRNEANGNQLPRRAKQQASVGADYRVAAWALGGSLLHVGQRYDDAANTKALAAYTTLDVYADWQVAPAWNLQAKVNNVTDRDYQTALGYNQPRRGFYLTLRWQPK